MTMTPTEIATRHWRRLTVIGNTQVLWLKNDPRPAITAAELAPSADVIDMTAYLARNITGLSVRRQHTNILSDGARFSRQVTTAETWGPVGISLYDEIEGITPPDDVTGTGWLVFATRLENQGGGIADLVADVYTLRCDGWSRRWEASEIRARHWYATFAMVEAPLPNVQVSA